MSRWLPILTTTETNLRARDTSCSVSWTQCVTRATHDVVTGTSSDVGEHLPSAVDKLAQLGEVLSVFLREELGNTTDGGANLLQRSRCIVVVLAMSAVNQR